MSKRTDHYSGDRELDSFLEVITDISCVKKVFPGTAHSHKHHKQRGTFVLYKNTSNGMILKLYKSQGSIPVYVSCTDPTTVLSILRSKGMLT